MIFKYFSTGNDKHAWENSSYSIYCTFEVKKLINIDTQIGPVPNKWGVYTYFGDWWLDIWIPGD